MSGESRETVLNQQQPISPSVQAIESISGAIPRSTDNIENLSTADKKFDDAFTFFDSLSCQWVQVDNFAFSDTLNHFENWNSLTEKQEVCVKSSDSCSILESDRLSEDQLQVCVEDEKIFEASLCKRNQIKDETVQHPNVNAKDGWSMPFLKLSEQLGSSFLSSSSSQRFKKGLHLRNSNIPGYARNANSQGPSFKQSPMDRKIGKLKANSQRNPGQSICYQMNNQRSQSACDLKELNFSKNANFRSEGSLNRISDLRLAGRKKEFKHVKSKVKEYIRNVKQDSSKSARNNLEGLSGISPERRSLSLSNLSRERDSTLFSNLSRSQNSLNRIKSFFQSEDVKIVLSKRGLNSTLGSLDRFDSTRISRLLDKLSCSDDEEDRGTEIEATFEVEEVLVLAMEERKEKKEAERVLSQLQKNYDNLQRKYAEAENKLDKLRFGQSSGNNSSNLTGTIDNANVYPADNNTSKLLCDVNLPNESCHDRQSAKYLTARFNQTRNKMHFETLKDLEDKLYMLDLQSDFSSLERRTAMEELKTTFKKLLQKSAEDAKDPPGLKLRDTMDQEFLSLLKDVGQKLYQLELQESNLTIPDKFIKEFGEHEIDHNVIDPIEKVAKWKENHAKEQTGSKSKHYTSSCYGSLPGSPIPTILEARQQRQQPSSPPTEFDSGYPGSDRSAKYYSLKGLSPTVSVKTAQHRFLFNLEEEEKSQGPRGVEDLAQKGNGSDNSSSLPSDFQATEVTANGLLACAEAKKSELIKRPSLHRTYVHSVTDLSSDERSMFESHSILPGLYHKTTSDLNRFMKPIPKTELERPTERQPIALAKQIDQEIIELRNFYDDHREEMMSILNDFSKESIHRAPPSSLARQSFENSKSSLSRKPIKNLGNFVKEAVENCETDLEDLERERRTEFKKRRHKKKHRVGGDTQLRPNFAIGKADSLQQQQQQPAISSFFPYLHTESSRDEGEKGRDVSTDFGAVFVPRLNLEDVWTDEDKVVDPRSFDFNLSLVNCQLLGEEPVETENIEVEKCSKDLVESFSQTVPREIDYAAAKSSILRTKSLSEIHHKQEPLVIVQTCCLHSDRKSTAGTGEEVTAAKISSVKRPATCRSSASAPLTKLSRPHTAREKKRNSQTKKEMKALLSSLDQANKMAASLHKRSQEIVKIFGQELMQQEETLMKKPIQKIPCDI